MLPKVFAFLALALLLSGRSEARTGLPEAVYRNAFLAARDFDFPNVLQHWYLFQSLNLESEKSPYAPRFVSLLWASVDALDLCPENLEADEAGDQLWPLVLHNYLVRHRRDQKASSRAVAEGLEAFKSGYQLRSIDFDQTLAPEEIKSLSLRRSGCGAVSRIERSMPEWDKERDFVLDDRARAVMMLSLLERAQPAWKKPDEAQLLDLRIQALRLFLNQQIDDVASQNPIILGLAAVSSEAYQRLEGETKAYVPQLLADSGMEKDLKIKQLLLWLDLALAAEEESQVERLISLIDELDSGRRSAIWSGTRGETLIQLGEKGAFAKGAAIALHRGVEHFRKSQVIDALREFARALRFTKDAESGEAALALKWIKYVLLQFRFEKRFMDFLRSYLDAGTFKLMAQDLIWTSAFYHEPYFFSSFALKDMLGYRPGHVKSKIILLAQGRESILLQELDNEMKSDPRKALQFMQMFLEQLNAQSNPVIENFQPFLRHLEGLLDRHSGQRLQSKVQRDVRKALDGLLIQGSGLNQGRQDRQVGGQSYAHLGTIAMEPGDALPWPFPRADRVMLNVFRVLRLQPQVNVQADQPPEYSWRISEK